MPTARRLCKVRFSTSPGADRPAADRQAHPSSSRGHPARRLGGAAVLGIHALGLLELVLEDHDAAGSLDRSALVDKLPGPGGDAQLVAGVAAVSAGGTQRGDQTGIAQGAEEALG